MAETATTGTTESSVTVGATGETTGKTAEGGATAQTETGGAVKTELGAAKTETGKTELGKTETKVEPVVFDATKLQLPEGMKSDDPLFKSFTEAFADPKLDAQARGQKLIDIYRDGVKAIQDHQRSIWDQTNDQWIKDVKSDPEIGGAKFEPTKATIAKAIDSLGPELSVAFRQGLDATGAGNHPAIWKGLAKMAALLTEGGHVAGNPPKTQPDLATAFFPNSKMT